MEGKKKNDQEGFTEILKKAYEKGINMDEITLVELVEELKEELRQILVS